MTLIETRIGLLKKMHNYVIDIGDEDLYYYWAMCAVPDKPDEEIFKFIATHEEDWLDCCKAFYNVRKMAGEIE